MYRNAPFPDESIANGIFVFRGDFDVPLASATWHAGVGFDLLSKAKPTDAQLAQALNEAQMAVSLAPNNCSYCQELLGDVLMKLNRKDEAKVAYQRGLIQAQSIYPDFQGDEISSLKGKLKQ